MKKIVQLLGLMACCLFLVFSCQKEESLQGLKDAESAVSPKNESISDKELVEHYLKEIEVRKAAGGGVKFQVGNEFVENPDRAWLEQHFGLGGEEPKKCEYCYWFEYVADVATSSANYDALDPTTNAVLWNQNVTHLGAGWMPNFLFVSLERCIENPPTCIRILWDMNTVGDIEGTCRYFAVKVRNPDGVTTTQQYIDFPIPSENNGSNFFTLCPVLSNCQPDPEGLCPNTCNCEYEILDIQVETPPGYPNYEWNFLSDQACATVNCGNLFNGYAFSGLDCNGNPSGCFDDLSGAPIPTGPHPFNCGVAPNSSFPVRFGSIAYSNCVTGTDLLKWTITYRINCRPDPLTASCDNVDNGTGTFSTGPITMTKTGIFNENTDLIRLTGCGCQPALDEDCGETLPDVFIDCAEGYRGFCLVDEYGLKINSESTLFAGTSVYWQAPTQYACFQGECADQEHGPQPYPSNGDILRFTIRKGNCFREYQLVFNCN